MINPVKTQLHILQLEGYDWQRFMKWWFKHPLTFSTSQKKPLAYTFKTKLILATAFILLILIVFLSRFPFNLIAAISLALEPFPLLLLSFLLIKPYEIIRRFVTIELSRRRILNHAHLTIIGIVGSYGKTSTKDFLAGILDTEKQTLKTPESYNTVFGIAKVIDLELHKKLNFFVCEMGAFVRGEVKELTHMVPPKYSILTAIGTQHLERFGSLTNTTLAKFEIVDVVGPENALVNLDNKYIREHLDLPPYQKVKTYSLENPEADFFVKAITINKDGTVFSLVHRGKTYPFKTKLFGTSNLTNLSAAIGMSFMLGVDPKAIQEAVEKIVSSPHRLELIKVGNATLIDNAYSSNEEGFTRIILDLKSLPGKKALITPGIIELGKETSSTHEKIGSLVAEVFDQVILVGRSERTENLSRGIAGKVPIVYLDNNSSVWPTIDSLSRKFDWILLENDLPDNF